MSKTIYAIIDFETTGFHASEDQVIEMACVLTDLKRDLGTFHTYINLDRERFQTVPEDIIALTKVTTYLTDTGIQESVAMELLQKFIYGDDGSRDVVVVAQFAPFDFSFMAEYGFEHERFICTRALAKLIEPEESASLANVYRRLFKSEVPSHHSALADVQATKKVLAKQLERAEQYNVTHFENVVIDSPERPLKFIPKYASVEREGDRN